MSRRLIRVSLVALLIGVGWVAGRAQSPRADFEIVVSAPFGRAEVTCLRGCAITWAEPAKGQAEIRNPQPKLQGAVTSSSKGCVAAIGAPEDCRILGFIKR